MEFNNTAGKKSALWKDSLKFRLTAIIAFVSILTGIIMFLFLYFLYQNRIDFEYRDKVISISRIAAALLDIEVIERYASTLEEDEEYARILNFIRIKQKEIGVTYICISVVYEHGELFIFDSDEDEEGRMNLGSIVLWTDTDYDADLILRFLRGDQIEPYTERTRWGYLLTAVEPIFRTDGSLVAHASVSISMDNILNERMQVFILLGIIVIIVFSLSIIINLNAIQKHVISPLHHLIKGLSAYRPEVGMHKFMDQLKSRPRLNTGDEYEALENAVINLETRIENKMDELQKAEELSKLMLDTTPICCQLWDSNFAVIDCNEAAVKLYGFNNKQEFLERFFRECSPEYQGDGQHSDEKAIMFVKKAFEEGSCVFDWMHQMPDGTPLPAEITLVRTSYKDGYVVAGYTRDLRHIKKMEEALTEAEKMTKAIMEASPVSYVLFDKDLNAIDCNKTTLDVFACPSKQFFLDHYWKRFSPAYQPDGRKTFEKTQVFKDRVLKEGKVIVEWDHRSFKGEHLPTETILTRMTYNNEIYIIAYKYDLRRIKKMEENIRRLESEVEKVYIDPLTGIYNRRYFDENLDRAVKTLSRSGGMMSLMMIDIDHFKKYNDTYGHSEGDNCLKIIAETLSKTVTRADDFAARYGGEEFAVVLPNTDEKGARVIAEKLLENIRNCNIPHENSDVAKCVTISIGVTTSSVSHTQNPDHYIKRADEMLYESKQNGRDRYTFGSL